MSQTDINQSEEIANKALSLVFNLDEKANWVCDMLANIMHWCDINGYDFQEELERGTRRYVEESEEEDDKHFLRFCEFTGDEDHSWDEAGHKKICSHVGIMDNCLKFKEPLGKHDGWRTCCEACSDPVQVKQKEEN